MIRILEHSQKIIKQDFKNIFSTSSDFILLC